jgi:hypothetical protein
MGTRGCFGVRIDGEDKVTYNHFDSYPDCLGKAIVEQVGEADLAMWAEQARALKPVLEGDKPTPEEIEQLKGNADLGVSGQSFEDWYCLLRNLQGDLRGILNTGVFIDSHDFLSDSLFCEWAYIVNLDEGTLEVYRGFQQEPHTEGRYAGDPIEAPHRTNDYYPVALFGTFPLGEVTKENMEECEKKAYPDEEEDDES